MALDQSKHIDYEDDEERGIFTGEKEMSFIDHLEELRWHLIRATGAVLVFTIIAFAFIREIYQTVILGPARTDFWTYRKMCQLGNAIGIESLCVDKLNFELQSRELTGQFMMSITSSIIIGLLFTFPYAFWEVWRFIKPGLKDAERKAARGAVFYVTALFFIGILFGYYIVAPLTVNFLANYQIDPSIKNQFDITSYISVLATLVLACGITFQMPIVVFVLAKVGILTPQFMRAYRRHAFVVIMVLGAVITPSPDPFSMMVVALPLYVLYELSIGVAVRVEKTKIKTD
jgi:sec-independent protein translocase protein TatC